MTQFNKHNRLRLVIAGMGIIYVTLVIVMTSIWYSDQMVQEFRFFNDLDEWKQLDKISHFFWTFQVCALVSRMLRWGGMELETSTKWASIAGFFFVSSIEIPDGFSTGYGASLFDMLANLLGAIFFFVQMSFWRSLKIFSKFSFHPTSFAVLRPSLLGQGFLHEMIKDYNGQTFWFSWTPEKKWWPQWLAISIGVGAEGMVYSRDLENEAHNFSPYRKLFFSFDLNVLSFNFSQRWMRVLIYPLQIFKCPAPAVELSVRGFRFHWLYF